MTILDEIAERTRERIAVQKSNIPETELREAVKELLSREKEEGKHGGAAFEAALAKDGMSFICEVKKASPSKGVIAQDFPYLEIAKEYEKAGASAMSILTEPFYFKGSDQYLREIRKEVSIPFFERTLRWTHTCSIRQRRWEQTRCFSSVRFFRTWSFLNTWGLPRSFSLRHLSRHMTSGKWRWHFVPTQGSSA